VDLTNFLNLSPASWAIVDSIAGAVAAIGTVAAVVVSLLLAGRASTYKAKVWAGVQLLIDVRDTGPAPQYVEFRVTNVGERPFTISQIGWSSYALGRKLCIQLYDRNLSSKLPVELSHGQQASWMVPYGTQQDPWIRRFADLMLRPQPWVRMLTLRARFMTTTGHTFGVRPNKDLRTELRKHLRTTVTNGG
jgi:hypothetical protein